MDKNTEEKKIAGLLPLGLAETNVNDRNGIKCFFAFQKVLAIIFFIMSIVVFYFLIIRLLNNDDTKIIVISRLQEIKNKPGLEHEKHEILETDNSIVNLNERKKRETISLGKRTNHTIFKDNQRQRVKKLISERNVLCHESNKDVCRDIIMKIKSLTENDLSNHEEFNEHNKTDQENIENTQSVKNKRHMTDVNTANVSKRDTNDIHIHSLLRPNKNTFSLNPDQDFEISEQSNLPNTITYQHDIPHSQLPENCLWTRLMRQSYSNMKGLYDDHGFPSVSSFSKQLASNFPFDKTSDTEEHTYKPHPQDIEIAMNYMIPKHETSSKELSTNTSVNEMECAVGTISCDNGRMCISETAWCDGNVDCDDVSDESKCTCRSRVDESRICDGYFDCPFGDDEMECYGCSEGTFSCGDSSTKSQSTCYTKEQRCNNVYDCPNHKDEIDCSMLAPSLHKKPLFSVSHVEGYLHRNFKGNWYAVCTNPYMWAHDACRRETGLIIRPPFIQVLQIDPLIKVNFISTAPGGLIHTSNSCLNSSAVYVTCPDLLCGTRVLTASQLLRENAALENRLFGRNKRYHESPYPVSFYDREKRYSENKSMRLHMLRSYLDDIRSKRAESRVVGGKPSQPAAWPWMVALYRNGMFHCGGVIINQNWIMSAAHCVHKFWQHYYEVQVGMLRRFSFSPQEQNHRVTHVIVNQNYNQEDMKNDLSLLRVKPAIQFSRWVRPICLPSPEVAGNDFTWGPKAGTICTAVGWGATIEKGPDPDHMREVEVPVWDHCKHEEDQAGNEICAGLAEGGKDACQGDSGGPLLCRNPANTQQWFVAGIVSHGDGCARKGEPGVYTRVSLFVQWIRYHTSTKTLPLIQPKQECPGFRCDSGILKCLPKKRMCDKIIDCLDGEDEFNCDSDTMSENIETNLLTNPFTRVANASDKQYESTPVSKGVNIALKELNSFSNDQVEPQLKTMGNNDLDLKTSSNILSNDNTNSSETIKRDKISVNKVYETGSNNNNNDLDAIKIKKKEDLLHLSNNEDAHGFSSTTTVVSTTEIELKKFEQDKLMNSGILQFESITLHKMKPIIEIGNLEDDLNHSSTISSQENSDENITADPVVNEEFNHFISTETPKTTLNSVSAKLDKISANFNSQTVMSTTESLSSSTLSTSFIDEEKDKILLKNTDVVNLDKNNHTVQQLNDTFSLEDKNKKHKESEELIIQLLPVSHTNYTEEAEITTENFTTPNGHVNSSESKIDMTFSELQPVKIRKKHQIPTDFQCKRIFQTVPYIFRCDHKADCEDGTDEFDCNCLDYLASYDNTLICDGSFDCADGQDENDCYSCGADQFFCRQSGICLASKYICDGKAQCPLGEDELDCYTLSNGNHVMYDLSGKPQLNLEGFVTKRHGNKWQILCEDDISIYQQEETASHTCRYLGFSSANRYFIKYINVKEQLYVKEHRNKRDSDLRAPVNFAYRSNGGDEELTAIADPELIKEECVPNITKTCMAIYVFCEQSLFTDFNMNQRLRNKKEVDDMAHNWPWIAKLYVDGKYRCTGVLVDLSWVLINNYCLHDVSSNHHYVTVLLGSHKTLDTIIGPYEQICDVDGIKNIYKSKVTVLHLKKPAVYSSMVKPMVVTSSYFEDNTNSQCVAVGQDNQNKTFSVFLKETEDCDLHQRCFVRQKDSTRCRSDAQRLWSGIVSCHTKRGWYPAATFLETSEDCSFEEKLIATDIGNLKHEIKHYEEKTIDRQTDSTEEELYDNCEGVRCQRGSCIKLRSVCDGVADCEDGIDESKKYCQKKHGICNRDPHYRGCECPVGQLKCHNGLCISKELFGNGQDDCGDGTDEPKQTSCSDYLRRVMPSRLCDGILHCHDRSDEDPMFCKCFAKKAYKCSVMSNHEDYCVAMDMVCDGVRDCPHGEDENTCIGLNAPQDTPHGIGEVIVRSHGVWHSKCYTTQNHTKSELEAICRELGFISGHAKQLPPLKVTHPHNNVFIDKFSDVILNNNTIIKLRNSHAPLARAVTDDTEDCHPVFIECL